MIRDTHFIEEKKLHSVVTLYLPQLALSLFDLLRSDTYLLTGFFFFFLDTTVIFKSAPVTWSPHIMPPFTIFACCYSGLLLRSRLAKTLVAGVETRTSNLFPTQCTWSSTYWTRKICKSALTDTRLRHLRDRGQCLFFQGYSFWL